MNPEVKIIRLDVLAAQQDRFAATAEHFGQEYARGQNQFTEVGRSMLARISGRPTPSQQISETAANLTEARLNLAEARARLTAQGAPDDATYQQELANHFAGEYIATGQEILTTAQSENSNLGIVDDIHRANINAGGSTLRFLGGFALIFAASSAYNLIQGPNATTATEIGIFISATGALDTARQVFLDSFTRNRINILLASTASLIRRRASIHEGQITGDEITGSQPIDLQLEERLADETLAQLQLDGIRRPDLTNPTDYSDILRQRASLRSRLPRYEDLPELVRSRNIARVSRLTRTLLIGALAAGLIYFHATRFEDCGSRTFPQPDVLMQNVIGVSETHSWRGVAENEWFKRVFNKDFDAKNPQDRVDYNRVYGKDPAGNNKIVETIVVELKKKNPQIKSVGRDLFRSGTLHEVCLGELDDAFNQAVPSR